MFGSIDVTSVVFVLVSLVVSLSLHEAMHAYVGLKLGDDTAAEAGRVSLNPLRHIDPLMTVILPLIALVTVGVPVLAAKPVPFNPERVRFEEYGAALIALAGPAANLVLAGLAAIVLRLANLDGLALKFVEIFLGLNVSVMIFNLVPIPPLDGSRALYAIAPDAVRRLFAAIEPYGIIIVFGLVFLTGFGVLLYRINQAVLQFLL